nr:extracellular solute-binding protein [uncultured Haemophilus sp.]
MATIKDIAKEAGVSLGTVSNVLNKKHNVSLKKIELVNNAIQKLGYQKNIQASFLKSGENNQISVIFPSISQPEYYLVYESLESYFSQQGYQLNLYLTDNNPIKERSFLEKVSGENTQIIISVSCLNDANEYKHYFDFKTAKIIFLYQKIKNEKHYLDFDYKAILNNFLQKLKENGENRVGIISTKKYKFDTNVDLVYCQSQQAFDIVKFIQDKQIPALITLNIAQAEAVYNAFYFANQNPPKIYTINHQFNQDERFISYYISYDFIIRNIIHLIEGERIDDHHQDKGFLFTQSARLNSTLRMLAIQSPSVDALKKLLPHFERQTGIQVQIDTVPFAQISAILMEPNKAKQYDIVRLDMERLPLLAEYLQPISFISENDLSSHYSSHLIDRFCLVKNKLFAIPFDPSIQVLFYHKAIFDDMIIQRLFYEQYKTDLTPPKTFEEFNRIARFFDHNPLLKSPIRYGTALIDNPEILALEFLVRYYALANNPILSEENSTFNTEIALAVLQNLAELKESAVFLHENWWGKAVEFFEKKETAMLLIYANHYSHLSHNMSSSIGCSPVPGNMPLIGGGSLVMVKGCQKQEEVRSFFEWFLNDEINDRYVNLGGVSARKNVLMNQALIKQSPWISLIEKMDFNGVRENVDAKGNPINLVEIEKQIGLILFDFLNGQISVDVAVGEIADVFTREGNL